MEATSNRIGSTELCEATGLTYRALDYWCRNGVIPDGGNAGGSGSRRSFDAAIVPKVRVVAQVAQAFQNKDVGQLSTLTYAEIYENHDEGFIRLANGVCITWPI
jgi:DNA-binding transcriptional MerR regulator